MTKESTWAPVILFSIIFVLFFSRTADANIFADDAAFLSDFGNGSLREWVQASINYVPGRNLHVIWQDLIYFFSGTRLDVFWKYHLIQSFFYLMVFIQVYFILRKVGISQSKALVVSIGLSVLPVFSSILLWPSALPMHIISCLFLLFAFKALIKLPADNDRSRSMKNTTVCLFLTFGMYTYDQAAVVVLLLTFLGLISGISPKVRRITPLFFDATVRACLAILSITYVTIILAGRGTDNQLSIGDSTFERFGGNLQILLRIPVKFSNEIWEYISVLNLGIFFSSLLVAILALVVVRLGFALIKSVYSLHSFFDRDKLYLATIFLISSFAAISPSAIWYVSPRHLFLPIVLGSIAFTIFVNEFLLVWKLSMRVKWFFKFTSVMMILFLTLTFNREIAFWESRDSVRASLYSSLDKKLKFLDFPCIVISRDQNLVDRLLYSEDLNSARKYYSGQDQQSEPNCSFPAIQNSAGVFECDWRSGESWYSLDSYKFDAGMSHLSAVSISRIC